MRWGSRKPRSAGAEERGFCRQGSDALTAHIQPTSFDLQAQQSNQHRKKQELVKILEGAGLEGAADRYLDLCVRDDAPW